MDLCSGFEFQVEVPDGWLEFAWFRVWGLGIKV